MTWIESTSLAQTEKNENGEVKKPKKNEQTVKNGKHRANILPKYGKNQT